MSVVVDASFICSLLLPDEKDDRVLTLAKSVFANDLYAPALIQCEVLSILVMAVRRKRITSKQRDRALSVFEQLRIRVDGPINGQQLSQVLKLADEYGLTAYDAAYLELGVRLRAGIATFDKELQKAVRKEGLDVFG